MKRLREYFTRKEIVTVPNLLSVVRLLLIPLCVYTYIGRQDYRLTALLVVLSALTDIVDGWIARHFHQTSDLGKALDPFADKLTQIVILFCLAIRYPYLLGLGILLCIKELCSAVASIVAVKRTGEVRGARWHGKITTVAMYTTIMLHLLWVDIPKVSSYFLVGVCLALMLLSFILYMTEHITRTLKARKGEKLERG